MRVLKAQRCPPEAIVSYSQIPGYVNPPLVSYEILGGQTGEAFSLYVEHFLCPTLERGQIVVWTICKYTRCEGLGS